MVPLLFDEIESTWCVIQGSYEILASELRALKQILLAFARDKISRALLSGQNRRVTPTVSTEQEISPENKISWYRAAYSQISGARDWPPSKLSNSDFETFTCIKLNYCSLSVRCPPSRSARSASLLSSDCVSFNQSHHGGSVRLDPRAQQAGSPAGTRCLHNPHWKVHRGESSQADQSTRT